MLKQTHNQELGDVAAPCYVSGGKNVNVYFRKLYLYILRILVSTKIEKFYDLKCLYCLIIKTSKKEANKSYNFFLSLAFNDNTGQHKISFWDKSSRPLLILWR